MRKICYRFHKYNWSILFLEIFIVPTFSIYLVYIIILIAVGHFTQAIWNRSKYIGVAKVKDASGQTTVIVAEYDPPGNYIGQFRANVLSPC